MSKRNKIIIAISVILAILIIFLIVLSLGEEEPTVNQNINKGTGFPGQIPLGEINEIELPKTLEESKVQSNLNATALTFAEKFGSFSNQSGFENLDDLKVMMTQSMISWTNRYIIESKAKLIDGEEYIGYTTKALSANIQYQTNSDAEVVVTTQRSESRGVATEPRIFYQQLQLQFKNIDGAWRVDNAVWQ
ncbi:hypothetical protein KKA15_01675 [Patescibacteria group bacterium]|nr:hypothetical protein [Patescibacteria group bacterium]